MNKIAKDTITKTQGHKQISITNELGLIGLIKNTFDNKVKIMAEGEEDKLKKMIEWRYNGSSGAVIGDIKTEWAKAEKNLINLKFCCKLTNKEWRAFYIS